MKMIVAIIQPERLDAVKEALFNAAFEGAGSKEVTMSTIAARLRQ